MDQAPEAQSDDERIGHLASAVDELRRRMEALEEMVGGLAREIREWMESEDIGVTQ